MIVIQNYNNNIRKEKLFFLAWNLNIDSDFRRSGIELRKKKSIRFGFYFCSLHE